MRKLAPEVNMVELYEGLAAYRKNDFARAKEIFLSVGQGGDGRGWYYLGKMHSQGQGMQEDAFQAAKLYLQAIDGGCTDAAFDLGALHAQGRGVRQDFAEALKCYKVSAMVGDAEANFRVGTIYDQGQGVAKNLDEAQQYYSYAAQLGHPLAMRYLGLIYIEKVEKAIDHKDDHLCTAMLCFCRAAVAGQSDAAAEIWRHYEDLEKLAKAGFPAAQWLMGRICEEGYGRDVDLSKAFAWYQLAAKEKHPTALSRLGNFYRDGDGVAIPNEQSMIDCYKQAAELGDEDAQHNLAFAYTAGIGVEQDNDLSINWYRKAAQQGGTASRCDLALKLFERQRGSGATSHNDSDEAMDWLYKAARSGSARAMMIAADAYQKGDVVGQDLVQAARWLMTALYNNHFDAMHEFHEVAALMTADQLKEADKLAGGDGSWSAVAIDQQNKKS